MAGRSLTTGELQEIERKRDWIEENRESYMDAIAKLSDPTTARAYLKGILMNLVEAQHYDPMVHPPHYAVAIVSKIQERIASIVEDIDFLDEFEERRGDYAELAKLLPDE